MFQPPCSPLFPKLEWNLAIIDLPLTTNSHANFWGVKTSTGTLRHVLSCIHFSLQGLRASPDDVLTGLESRRICSILPQSWGHPANCRNSPQTVKAASNPGQSNLWGAGLCSQYPSHIPTEENDSRSRKVGLHNDRQRCLGHRGVQSTHLAWCLIQNHLQSKQDNGGLPTPVCRHYPAIY